MAALRLAVLRLPVMRFALSGPTPDPVRRVPQEPWFPHVTAPPGFADAFYLGRYRLGGYTRELGHSPFAPEEDEAPAQWLAALHGFGWLRPLADEGTALARANAQAFLHDWSKRFGTRLAHPAWEPLTAARRLDAFITHRDLLHEGASAPVRKAYLKAVGQHVRALRLMADATTGSARVEIGIALAIAHRALLGRARGLGHVQKGLRSAIGPDGGPRSADPREAVRLLCGLKRIAEGRAEKDTPPFLTRTIENLSGWLADLRHGDGTFAQFNGTGWIDPTLVERLSLPSGTPSGKGETGSYARMEGGAGAIAIVDRGGRHRPEGYDSAGAFELSVAQGRIVVSCGVPERNGQLAHALRDSAAHSTLSVIDTDGDAEVAVPEDAPPVRGEGVVRVIAARGTLLHRRVLRFAPEGLTGSDEVEGPGAAELRFHLHPDVEAAASGPHAVDLSLEDGALRWTFHCVDAPVRLEETVVFALDAAEWSEGRGRASRQIVIDMPARDDGADTRDVRWMFVPSGA